VTLDGQANDGRPGEGDDVRDVEVVKAFVAGTWVMGDGPDRVESYAPADLGPSAIAVRGGDDVVLAGNGTQAIDGGAGADRLEGGFGDDTITGGPGRDTIAADVTGTQCGVLQSCTLPNGDDVVDARDGEADTVSCGVGTDRVVADTADVVAADCEQVDRAGAAGPAAPAAGAPAPGAAAPGATPARPVVVAGQRLRTALRRGLRVRVATAGTVRALHGRRTVATGRGRGVVTLRFTAAARRALAGRRTVRLTLVAGTARTTVTLRR
jgi:hypothetical protein